MVEKAEAGAKAENGVGLLAAAADKAGLGQEVAADMVLVSGATSAGVQAEAEAVPMEAKGKVKAEFDLQRL